MMHRRGDALRAPTWETGEYQLGRGQGRAFVWNMAGCSAAW